MRQLFFFFMLFISGTIISVAQATATFTASVTIIQPIGITTTSNMNFGHVDAQSGGAVVLTPQNTRISSGGVDLANSSAVSAATFEITGEPGAAFSISLPDGEYILTNGKENMILNNFTSGLVQNSQLKNDSKVVRVGATLHVDPKQTPGLYTSRESMSVTVNYN